jgi:hypothetical protein
MTYVQSGKPRRFLRPLLLYFGETKVDKIDHAAIMQAALALYPDASPATRNRQVLTPMSAILKVAGVRFPLQRPKPTPGRVRWLTEDEARRLVAACSPHLKPHGQPLRRGTLARLARRRFSACAYKLHKNQEWNRARRAVASRCCDGAR